MEKFDYEKPELIGFKEFKDTIVHGASCGGEVEDIMPCICGVVSGDVP